MTCLAASDTGWFGVAFASFGGLFTLIGFALAVAQAKKLRTYKPVPAVVIAAEVAAKSSSEGGSTYAPKVTYEYQTPTGPKRSSKTLTVDMSSGRAWAAKIIAPYKPGMATLAYVDPNDDEKVFLVHEMTLMPYGFILFSMIFVSIGLGLAVHGFKPFGWGDADQLLAVAMFWHAMGLLCLLHYRSAGGKLSLGPQMMFALYVGVGLIALWVWDDLRNQPPPSKPVPRVVRKKSSRPPARPTDQPVEVERP